MKIRKKRKKHGVSPLVATVLLVGFTVALVALTILWSRGYIEERAQKEEKLSTTKLNCENVVFEINSIEQNGYLLDINLENKASQDIDGFVFRINGDETEVVEWHNTIKSLNRFSLQLGPEDFDASKVGTINTVDIIPLLKAAKNKYVPCSNQHLEVRVG